VESTFRLPVLKKSAEFHSEMVDQILVQRDEQYVMLDPQELEDYEREMAKLKKAQARQ